MGKEGEREGEKDQCVVASHTPPTGDLAHNPGMCPDWESNRWPCDLQASAQSTEPHQPGLVIYFIIGNLYLWIPFSFFAFPLTYPLSDNDQFISQQFYFWVFIWRK